MEAIDRDKIKEDLSDELCEFCPWRNGEIPHACVNVCDGNYCDDALDSFLEENEQFFDEDDNDTRQSLFRNRRV